MNRTTAICLCACGISAFAYSAQRGSAGYVPQVNAGERDLRDHRYSSAASHFRYALVWDSKGVAAHVGLGNVYLQTGRPERARSEFAAALKESPHSADAERGIHESRSDGEEQQAFQELEDLVHQDPANADLVTTYSEELVERGRLAEAKKEANAALKLDPHQWHAFCALGRIAYAEGDMTAAETNLKIAISHDSRDDDAMATYGDLMMSKNRLTEALALYRNVVKLAPEEPDYHTRLAAALDRLGMKAEAAKETAIAAELEKQSGDGGK